MARNTPDVWYTKCHVGDDPTFTFLKPYSYVFRIFFVIYIVHFSYTVSYCFVLIITIVEENRQDISVITVFLFKKTLCTWHYCCMLPAQIIKCQKGAWRGKVQQWILCLRSEVNLCLFRVVSYSISYFCWFFVSVNFDLYVCKSFRISFRMCRHDRKTMNNSHALYFVFCISYGFFVLIRIYFVCMVSKFLMEGPCGIPGPAHGDH
jgi:hypothetical protein